MKFVKTDDLKIGMILAKPIYNKKGVLLYDRNSKLTQQGIESVLNFGLIGIYILEPAEPLPPMSEDDIEFEKFQAIEVFSIIDELQSIAKSAKQVKIYNVAQSIIRSYGRLDHKINFIQSLRSSNDFVYKHSLNVAILCALMSHKLNMKPADQEDLIVSAIVHACGIVSPDEKVRPTVIPEDEDEEKRLEYSGFAKLDEAFVSKPQIKRTAIQAFKEIQAFRDSEDYKLGKIVNNAKVLIVADLYDSMTAMNSAGETPYSEIAALKYFMEHPDFFDREVVDALVASINFLAEGSCVELNNGEKALVLSSNARDVLRPTVLCFSTNKILDLGQTAFYGEIEIVDVMKTLDNRHVMDMNMLESLK
ncbi:MAG: phosphohydrolase [Lachnospiraceae bacterium]|nr:phosphohydrolase [Lachnospiraceae bacterium]